MKGKGFGFDEGGGAADIAGMVGVGEGDKGVGGAIGGLHVAEVVAGDFKDGAAFGREATELGEDAAGGAIDVGGDEEAAVGGDEAGKLAEEDVGGVAEVAVDLFEDGVVLDLRTYHAVQGRRYKLLQLVFAVMATLVIARSSSSVRDWLANAGFALVAAACSVVALRTRGAWLDTAAAVLLLAMAPVFLWMHLQALAG